MIMGVRRYLSGWFFQMMIVTVSFLILPLVIRAQAGDVGQALDEMLHQAKQEVEPITVEELSALMVEDHDVKLIDVRTEAEYQAGHLRGALWSPRGKLEFAAAGDKIGSTDDEIVVYCKQDGRSSLAGATLKRLGFEKVRYLEGGFELWVTSGYVIYNMHGELTVVEYGKSEE
jgi:rhodanese-related sulfurtransferase